MLKISENNGTEEIGLVTPTPGQNRQQSMWREFLARNKYAIAMATSHDNYVIIASILIGKCISLSSWHDICSNPDSILDLTL